MRIGGLATGMDIDSLVEKLMEAERIPFDKMKQDRTKLTWKQDAFRDLNKSLLELDNMVLNMKMSSTYNPKKVVSTQEGAVTGVPSSSSSDRMFRVEVSKLATSATNMSKEKVGDDVLTSKLSDLDGYKASDEIKFSTYKNNGELEEHKIVVDADYTVKDVLDKINADDSPVRAFYDHTSEKVIMETTRTGQYNIGKDENPDVENTGEEDNDFRNEIEFEDNSFFTNVLKLDKKNEKGGEDASFTYNGQDLTSKNNSYDIDGTLLQFHNVTNGTANISISTDEDAIFDSIVEFVDKYNEVIEKFNDTQQEERFRDFPPLTDEQKKDMSEDEIKKWEEKAQSGILKGESIVSNGLYNMRSSWYSQVDNDQGFSSITQIGITTSERYLDGGKLEIDEDKLRKAISEDAEGVHALFSNSSDKADRGIINRLDEQIDQISKNINNRAGKVKGTTTLDNYALGKRMKAIDQRISDFEVRLKKVEDRYWNQFTQMEKAIQRMNDQSAQLFSQFGDM